jgi:hypothetical protein
MPSVITEKYGFGRHGDGVGGGVGRRVMCVKSEE